MNNSQKDSRFTLCYGMRLDPGVAPEQEHPHVPIKAPNGQEEPMALHVIHGSLEDIKAQMYHSVDAFFEIYREMQR